MILRRNIAIDQTVAQAVYFRQAAGVGRFAWNCALAEWKRQADLHKLDRSNPYPSESKLRLLWNEIRHDQFPWSYKVTKCAGAISIQNLGLTFSRAFNELRDAKKEGRKPREMFGFPKFKSKQGSRRPGFSLLNDQFIISNHYYGGKPFSTIRVPNLGAVRLHELVPSMGKVLSARIIFRKERWILSILFDTNLQDHELSDRGIKIASAKAKKRGEEYTIPNRTKLFELCHQKPGTIGGFDFGVKSIIVGIISDDSNINIPNPKRLTKIKHKERILLKRRRKFSKSILRARQKKSIENNIPLEKVKHKLSNRQRKLSVLINKTVHNQSTTRNDFNHKISNRIAKSSEIIVLEDLNIIGMMNNHRLADTLKDAALSTLRHQIEYKSEREGGLCLIAPRWYASSKRCFACGEIYKGLVLGEDEWICPSCGVCHDRDENAAKNLALLGELAANNNEIPEDLAKWTNWIHEARVQVEEWRARKSEKQTSFDVLVGTACPEFTRREITERGTSLSGTSGVIDELRTKDLIYGVGD